MAQILIVDDERNVRRMLEVALVGRGHEVQSAADGLDAIRILKKRGFDVLICDLRMPRADGQTVIEFARALRPAMGLILVTAHKTTQSVIAGFRRGLHAYLQKPIDLERLYSAVDGVLRLRDQAIDLGEVQVEQRGDDWIEFTAPSHVLLVERFENLFRQFFDEGVDQHTLDDLRVAITELGGNAVEWGNRSDLNKPVQISAKRQGDRIFLMFKDKGGGFDLKEVPNPIEDPIGVLQQRKAEGKRPGGYGIALVRQLVDRVVYNKQGNLVMIVKKLRGSRTEP